MSAIMFWKQNVIEGMYGAVLKDNINNIIGMFSTEILKSSKQNNNNQRLRTTRMSVLER